MRLSLRHLFLIFIWVLCTQLLFATHHSTLRLQLKWLHQFQFAGYYAAIEKGYYHDMGFNVQLLEPVDNQTPFDAVSSGKADFGTCTTDILIARDKGKKMVVLATIFQHSPQIFIALKQSGIMYAHDLVGKRIAVEPGSDALFAYLIAEGVDLKRLIIDESAFDYNKLTQGLVDAITAYSTDEPYSFAQDKQDITILYPASAGIDFYGDMLFTGEQLIREEPQLVADFRAASLKGWAYAMSHQEEIVQLIYNKYSRRHSLDHLRFEATQMQKLILPDVVEIGYSNPGRWEAILADYKKLGRVKHDMATNGLMYSDYIHQKRQIHWKLIFIYSIALLLALIYLHITYSSNRKLQREILKRETMQRDLEASDEQIKQTNAELVQANAEKSKFFSIIAHDLRSPFNSFLGLTQILSDKVNTFKQGEIESFAGNLHQSALNLFRLLENLLEWSRMEKGLTVPKPGVFSVNTAVEEIQKMYHDAALLKDLKIETAFPADYLVKADYQMIGTVLRNLLSNAIKFTPKGGKITVTSEKTKDVFIIITVRDTGMGMNKKMLDSLFKIDINNNRQGTEHESSTGLGLILCKEFVELNGGTLSVISTEGVGSAFSFTLKAL